MEEIYLKPTDKTPEVHFQFDEGIFLIRGVSIPENTVDFYHTLIYSIKEYARSPQPKTSLRLAYEYFNTSTSAIILKLIQAMDNVKGDVEVVWYCEEDDFEMEEVGADFSHMTSSTFRIERVSDLYRF